MASIVNLRPAVQGDIELLYALYCTVFRSHIEQLWGWDEQWQRGNFRCEFKSSSTLVSRLGGQDIGYLQVLIAPHRMYLKNIALWPEVQGKGIGSILVKDLQDEALRKAVPLELSVFRTNPRAQQFYQRLGFRQVGQNKTHLEMVWHPV